MVAPKRVMRVFHTRLEKLIALELALEMKGETIYDLSYGARRELNPRYARKSYFDYDMGYLASLGLTPDKPSRREQAMARLANGLDTLVNAGYPVAQLGRAHLALLFGTSVSHISSYAIDLARMFSVKYNCPLPAFAASPIDARTNLINNYNDLLKSYPEIKPTTQELARALGKSVKTVRTLCGRYDLGLSNLYWHENRTRLRRAILTLEGQLEEKGEHTAYLTKTELKKHFAGWPTKTVRAEIRFLANNNYLEHKADPDIAAMFIAARQMSLQPGDKPGFALRDAGLSWQKLGRLAAKLNSDLESMLRNGQGLNSNVARIRFILETLKPHIHSTA